MKYDLRFFGIGSAFNPDLGNTSAWFSREGSLFVLDCGETVFERLWPLPELRDCTEIYAVITHLHNDHAGSLAALASGCYYDLGKKIHVVHPEDTVNQLMALMGIARAEYHYHSALPKTAGVSFEAVAVEHAADMNCYGYIVRTPEWSAYFSGDAKSIPDRVLEGFRSGEIGRLYQDTSTQGAGHHAGLAYLEQVIEPALRERVYCVHLEQGAQGAVLEKGFQIPDKEG